MQRFAVQGNELWKSMQRIAVRGNDLHKRRKQLTSPGEQIPLPREMDCVIMFCVWFFGFVFEILMSVGAFVVEKY